MPTWGEILGELSVTRQPNGQPDFDGVRRKYLQQLRAFTHRDTIIYYSDWLAPRSSSDALITLEDMQGLMEVCKDLRGPELDLVLHTPGGSPEATASLVAYLRQRFSHIRAFVPLAAMSAGTMWALSANEIVMGKHSQLGPIDPQMSTGQGFAPAKAIVQQFERAKREIADDASAMAAWYPILQQYGTSLLEECEAAEKLSKRLVATWLTEGMFADRGRRAKKDADDVAEFFADFPHHQSHSLGITRAMLEDKGLAITPLETDQVLQDAVLSVHHATMHTFAGPAVKIIENHLSRAFVKINQQQIIPQMVQIPIGPPSP